MSTVISPATFELTPADNDRLAGLCGQFNEHLKQIEAYFGVGISNRGHLFSVSGDPAAIANVEALLHRLYAAAKNGINAEDIHFALAEVNSRSDEDHDRDNDDPKLTVRTRKAIVRGENRRQRQYIRNILTYNVTFGVGPAGTGKTYLAVACAVNALLNDEIRRIVLVRPAVEAGERLGFLPGDIGQKVDPYLRPLYDALYEMLGFEKVGKLLDRGVIELAPLAYMRGRTLNESFVILDEAQNTTVEQMKMFLTRTGFNSKVVVTGDVTQIDLSRGTQSGLKHAVQILSDVEGIAFTHFYPRDVVRHPMVQRIVEAYDQHAVSIAD